MTPAPMFDLSGRVALVTGAGRGVGAAIASTLAAAGAAVAVNDLAPDRIEQTVGAIVDAGGRAIGARADVTSLDDVRSSVDAVVAELGPIDILVNNAGVPPAGLSLRRFVDTTPRDWEPYIAVNVYGVLHCTHALLRSMTERGWGRVVTIVSDSARVGEPLMAAYSAAKASAAGLMRSLAREVGPQGVTCNCVSLGSIEIDGDAGSATEKRALRYPVRRLGRAGDVAPAVLWLASPEAAWVTGQTVSVNGGYAIL